MSAPIAPAPLDLGRPIKGPTALGDDPQRFVVLTRALAVTDFKLRFYGSALGYLWSLMKPFMLFGVLFTVFEGFLNFGANLVRYPVALLLGIVMFSFVTESIAGAVPSLVQRENLVRKVEFPRLAVPLATVLTALFSLVLNLVPVFVFLFALGGGISLAWLEFPFLIAGMIIFATGVSMLFSAVYVRYRDIQPITDVMLQILFYATPVFWTVDKLGDKAHWIRVVVFTNPFACVLEQSRHALISASSYPSAAEAIGGAGYLVLPIGLTVVVFVLGFRVFAKQAPRVAEDL